MRRRPPPRRRSRDVARPAPSVRRGRVSARRPAASRAACPPRASRDPNRDLWGPSLSCGSSFSTARQSVSLDLLVEIAPRHLQCARGLRHVPVVLLQLAEQERALRRLLELLEGRRAQPRCVPAARTDAGPLPSSPVPLPHYPLGVVLRHRGP